MESDGNKINRPCAHDVCAKWKRDGGHIRCRSLLTLFCETGSDVTKDDWIRALPLILGEASPQFYGLCFQCIAGPRLGYEYTWYFVVRFLNHAALLKAEQRLRTTVKYCLGYSEEIYDKKFKLEKLKESLRRNLRTLVIEFVDCFLYVAVAVSSDMSYKRKHSFGYSEVINAIDKEIRWYNIREHATPNLSRVTKDTPLSPSGQLIREKFIRKGKGESSRGKKRRGRGRKEKVHEIKTAQSPPPSIQTGLSRHSAQEFSWTTAPTEIGTAITAAGTTLALTSMDLREKAEILRLRLRLAGYKLRTGQTTVPFSELQHKPLHYGNRTSY